MATADRRSLWMGAGALVWALHFGAIYGYTGYACARGLAHTIAWTVGCTTLVAVTAALALVLYGLHRRRAFDGWLTGMVAAAALLGILWEGAVVLGTPPCAVR